MQEEVKKNPNVDNVDDSSVDYISAINELKQNTVDRSKYDELRAENKRLIDSLVNGETIKKSEVEEGPTIEELREKLFNSETVSNISNLDFWESTIMLREKLIAKGEKDPFLPYGEKIAPTYEDIQAAERVSDVVKQCIEAAEGDNDFFTSELQRRIIDNIRRR